MNKIINNFDEAVSIIPDGASVAVYFWSFPGNPQNLLKALSKHGAKNLTLITPNYYIYPLPEDFLIGPTILLPQLKKVIASYYGSAEWMSERFGVFTDVAEMEKNVEFVPLSHGILTERLRAAAGGMGPFYSPVGVGTIVEEGKEKRVFDGKEYILEMPLKPDFGFVRAHKADRYGNLVYAGTGRGLNPIIAMASKVTIAEVDEMVEPGEIDPEHIVTPAAFIDHIVKIPDGQWGSQKYMDEKVKDLLSVEWLRNLVESRKKQEQPS